MKIRIERVGPFSFAAHARGHLVVVDQPVEDGGTDTSMTPPELFLASLGTCVGYYVAAYLNTQRLDLPDLEIDVTGEILHNPGRVGEISVSVNLPVVLPEDRRRALMRVISHCTISNTLAIPPRIDVKIHAPSLEAAVPR